MSVYTLNRSGNHGQMASVQHDLPTEIYPTNGTCIVPRLEDNVPQDMTVLVVKMHGNGFHPGIVRVARIIDVARVDRDTRIAEEIVQTGRWA